MTPKVERTSAPQQTTKGRKKPAKTAESKEQIFNSRNDSQQVPTEHTVVKDETAFAIARKYNISIQELAAANGWTYSNGVLKGANGKTVTIGTGIKLRLPGNGNTTQNNTNTATPETYTIKKGDNPMDLAEKNNISIRQLAHANGWTVIQDKKGIRILENNKPLEFPIGKEINIPKSVTKKISDIKSMKDAQNKTGMSYGFVNLIKKHEGDAKNNFEPYTKAYQDSNGVWTIGYGNTKNVKPGMKITETQAYAQLAKDYVQIQEDLKIELGEDIYNKIPAPLREGLIDLVFNKGFESLDASKFKNAIKSGDVAQAMECLIFTKSIKTGEEMSGLYKRSLARLAMVYNGLDAESKKKVKPLIDQFYETAKTKVNESELNQWWTPNKNEGNPQNYQVKQGDTFTSIAKAHGISIQELEKLNPNIDPQKIKAGDNIVIPIQKEQMNNIEQVPQSNTLSSDISSLKLKNNSSYKQVLSTFNNYAQIYKLPPKAIEIFKNELAKEYNSLLYIDSDNMNAMAGILEANKTDELLQAIKTASKCSKDVKEFSGLALKSKINKDNIEDLIKKAGGTKEYINLMRKSGDFEILLHGLNLLVGDSKNKNYIISRFNEARQKGNYDDVVNIYNQVLAKTPQQISQQLAYILDKDDNLDSELYKYQIGKVNEDNVLEVLKANDIIAGICEAENPRSQCKTEITKLLNLLEKNYELNPQKKQEFIQLIDKEFQERSINPKTWWIATTEISKAFKDLISDVKKKKKVFTMNDAENVLFQTIGLPKGTEQLDINTDSKGNVAPLRQTFKPTKSGKLSGKRIVINSGHGGYNPDGRSFDKGALGDNAGTKIHEWSLNRFMADRIIKELLEHGAEVILTAGQVKSVAYLDLNADMTISLHADSHNGERSGPGLYVHPQDSDDKKLAGNILNRFIANEHTSNVEDYNRGDRLHKFKMKTNETQIKNMQIVISESDFAMLRRNKDTASREPSVLIEYCNMQKPDEIIDIVTGNLGRDMVTSIVNGIIDYWE